MFKFGRKDKDKSDEKKKERKDSKKQKKSKETTFTGGEPDNERYSSVPPQVAPKPKSSHTSFLNTSLKNGSSKSGSSRGILKIRSSAKSKGDQQTSLSNIDSSQILKENTRMNEEFAWRVPSDAPNAPTKATDRRKRESIHSITMNIAPPSVPPPPAAVEKDYSVDLQLPTLTPMPSKRARDLSIARQPKGDFGFNLRWAPYKDGSSGVTRQVVHAEPGTSGAKSGVITGDRIVEVNGVNVERSTREEVISLIQKSGDILRLRVQQIPEVSELNRKAGSGDDGASQKGPGTDSNKVRQQTTFRM